MRNETCLAVQHPEVALPGGLARRLLLTLGLSLLPALAAADIGAAETIASGLSNPRGIAFTASGALYVAEGGAGGPGPCIPSPVAPVNRCYGETGSVARILPEGGFERILTGLPSLALPNGISEGGPADVSAFGDTLYVTIGLGGHPEFRETLGGKSALFGTQLLVAPSGAYKVVSDVAGHEVSANPAGGNIDSNPYGAAALAGRRIVADAGANALVEVLANGSTRTFAVLPTLPPLPPSPAGREPVPTSVVEGPDGALYVGQLTSFPFWAGSASVLRVSSDGASVEHHAGGFTAIIDVAFDTGGALYVLEVAAGQSGAFPPPNTGLGIGRLLRQCPGESPAVLLEGLTFPSGVAIGPDGAAYLTNFGTSPNAGEVLRLPLAPCS